MKRNQLEQIDCRNQQMCQKHVFETQTVFAGVALMFLLVSANTALPNNTITLLSGTVAGQSVGAGNHEVIVSPGDPLHGSFTVRVHNEMPSSAIAPVAATPTWGIPSSSFWDVIASAPTGDTSYVINLPNNLLAPLAKGNYYVVLAMAGTYNSAQLMSGTQPAYSADWVRGSNVAHLSASDFEFAATNGWVAFNWYSPVGPSAGDMAMTCLRIVVAELNDGMVAYYPLDTDTKDASGNGNHATAYGSVSFVPSLVRGAAHLNSGNFIECNSATIGNFGKNSFAVSCWFKSVTGGALISKRAGCSRGNFIDLRVGRSSVLAPPPVPQDILFDFDDGTSSGHVETPLVFTNGVWHHVVVLRKGNAVTSYIDGAFAGQTETPGIFDLENNSPLRFGISSCTYTDPTPIFVGEIDEVRIYGRALSPAEVQQLWLDGWPRIALSKAVKPTFSNLSPGTRYQLQLSPDMQTWTNHGSPFTATNSTLVYQNYWDVETFGGLFFRLAF